LKQYGGDKGTWNPAQLLRLPGTSNFPDRKKRQAGITAIKSARLLFNKPGAQIPLGNFELAEPAGDMVFKAGQTIQRVEVPIEELQLDYNLPRWLVNIVKFGENPGEEHVKPWSRSEWLFKGVCGLVRYGVPNEYIKGLLLDPDYGIAESVLDEKQQRSADSYAERQVWRAHEAVYNSDIRELIESPIDPAHFTGEDGYAPDDSLLPGGAEYVQDTEAEAAPTQPPRTPKFKLWTGSELAAMPSLTWLIEDMLPKGSVGQLYGPTKQYKTFVTLDMALCVATGIPFQGKLVARARVVYVAGEGQYDIYPRFRAWCLEHGIVEAELDDWFRVCQDAVAVDEIEASGELRRFALAIRAVKEFMPVGFIVLDTLNKNMKGDEKDSLAMSRFVKGCELVKDAFKATVLIVHHTGHLESRARGSSVLISAVDASFRCAKINNQPHCARLTAEHIRAARAGWHIDLETHEVQVGEDTRATTLVMRMKANNEAARLTTRDRVLMAIASSKITPGHKNEVAPTLTVRALADVLKGVRGCGRTAVSEARNVLRQEGLLDEEYCLSPKGLERASELLKIPASLAEDQ
jgi:hypothetical protein